MDGTTTNLPEWKVDVVQAMKGARGIYSVCLVNFKVGSIFTASAVSIAVDNEEDEGFVASQGVVSFAMFESDNDKDYPVDAGGEDFEVMKE